MRETIKQLKEKLRKVTDEKYQDNFSFTKEIKELKEKNVKLKSNQERLLTETNTRAEVLSRIVSIVLGEAEDLSKYQVIRDMFRYEINEQKQQKKDAEFHNSRPNPSFRQSYVKSLHDKINEEDLE